MIQLLAAKPPLNPSGCVSSQWETGKRMAARAVRRLILSLILVRLPLLVVINVSDAS